MRELKTALIICSSVGILSLLGVAYIRASAAGKGASCKSCATGGEPLLVLQPKQAYPAIPGNPQTAVKSFHKIYQTMVAYRARHGRLPKGEELLHPVAPGVQLAKSDLENPDALSPAFLVNGPLTKDPNYARAYRQHRFNGQPKPPFPAKGERDLWFVSRHYMRMASVPGIHGGVPQRYGVMVGLFSDGVVEVKPVDELIAVRLAKNSMAITFPDQTGLPKDTLPVNVMLQRIFGRIKPKQITPSP